jgi:rubredoxin
MKNYVCTICGYIYSESAGILTDGISPGTLWEVVPSQWLCPVCGASKSEFKEQSDTATLLLSESPVSRNHEENFQELSVNELSALCSNLARGCEKQYLNKEADLFKQLAEYFKAASSVEEEDSPMDILKEVQKDLEYGFTDANQAANSVKDRGALRTLVWSEKVSRILNSLISRYEKEGDAFLEKTNVYVCTICGFVYVGDNPPDLCPVCKVPSWKFEQIERRQEA